MNTCPKCRGAPLVTRESDHALLAMLYHCLARAPIGSAVPTKGEQVLNNRLHAT